jgi:hypothetical protein
MTLPEPPTPTRLAFYRWFLRSLVWLGPVFVLGPTALLVKTVPVFSSQTPDPILSVVWVGFFLWALLVFFGVLEVREKLGDLISTLEFDSSRGMIAMDSLAVYCVHPQTAELLYQWHLKGRIFTFHFITTLQKSLPAFASDFPDDTSETMREVRGRGQLAVKGVPAGKQCAVFLDRVFGERLVVDREKRVLDKALPQGDLVPPRVRRL